MQLILLMMYAKHTTNVRGSYDFLRGRRAVYRVVMTTPMWRCLAGSEMSVSLTVSAVQLPWQPVKPFMCTATWNVPKSREKERAGGRCVCESEEGVGGCWCIKYLNTQLAIKKSQEFKLMVGVSICFGVVFFYQIKETERLTQHFLHQCTVCPHSKKKKTCGALYRLPFLKLFKSFPTSMTLVPGLIKMLNYPLCETT